MGLHRRAQAGRATGGPVRPHGHFGWRWAGHFHFRDLGACEQPRSAGTPISGHHHRRGRGACLGGRAGPRCPRGWCWCGGHVLGEHGRAGRTPRGPAALREGMRGRRPFHLRARRRAARQRVAPARRGHPHVRRHQDVRSSRGARRRAGDAPRVRDPQRHGAAHPAALQRGGVRRLELRAPRRPRRPQPGPVGPAPGTGGARGAAREGRHLRHVRRRRLRPALPHQASRQHRGLAARCAPRLDLCAARGRVLGRGGPAPERVHGCVAS
mmetsp:Transcript_142619/g.397395  ORF Transcript_142619/g.397395 Transcript_142619/m.397395 type:complete len:268 (+) Transcript_142619:2029-2832(+)